MRRRCSCCLPLWLSGRNSGAVDVGDVLRGLQIRADSRRSLRVDGQRVAAAALARDAQRVIAAVLVQVPDLERGDLRAPQSDLQADGENGAIAQAPDQRPALERISFRGFYFLVLRDKPDYHVERNAPGTRLNVGLAS